MKRELLPILAAFLLSGCGTGAVSAPPQAETAVSAHSGAEQTQTETTVSAAAETTVTARSETSAHTAADTTAPPQTAASSVTTATATETAAPEKTVTEQQTAAESAAFTAGTTVTSSAETTTETLTVLTGTEPGPDTQTAPAAVGSPFRSLPAGTVLTEDQLTGADLAELFTAEPLSDEILARISGCSYRENPDIAPEELCYLRMLHCNTDGAAQIGEMIVHTGIAADILEIFRALYDAQYTVARMVLIDEYGGSDSASMAANNTSCFNYRTVAHTAVLSRHAYGTAVDVNPLYNPYITRRSDGTEQIQPSGAEPYADRSADFPMKITEEDLCCRLFRAHGFIWGGNWSSPKDYQHFEKALSS